MDSTTPAEATVAFAALLVGALFYAALDHGGPFVAVTLISVVLYCAAWGMGVASQHRHCTPREKPNVGRSAVFALLAALPTAALLCLAAWYATQCTRAGSPSPCLRGLTPVALGLRLFHPPPRWQAFALVFPLGLLAAWGFTWLAFSLSNRNPCQPTNLVDLQAV